MIKQYGQPADFLKKYSPDFQLKICHDTNECLFGAYPTVGTLKNYGERMPMAWMLVQLTDLSEYCGCRDKLEGRPLEHCAEIIAQRYSYLKISELMLFFYRFKAGDYGRFYGSADPLVITTAIKSFIEDRNILISKRIQQMQEHREKADRDKSISYAEWQEMKQQQSSKQQPNNEQ